LKSNQNKYYMYDESILCVAVFWWAWSLDGNPKSCLHFTQ
jgi:hypothetical protein